MARRAKCLGCLLEQAKDVQEYRAATGRSIKEVAAVPDLRRMDDNVETACPKSRWMEKGCFIEDTAPNLAAHQLLNPSLSSEVSFRTYL